MKTILLTLLITCLGVWAQSPPTVIPAAADMNTREEILRRSVRGLPLNGAIATNAAEGANTTLAGAVTTVTVNTNISVTTNVVTTGILNPRGTNAMTPARREALRAGAKAAALAAMAAMTNRSGALGAVNNPPPAATSPSPVDLMGATAPGAAPAVAATAANMPAEHVFPPGEISFRSMKLDQFLDIYAKLVNRTVLHAQLPQVEITLVTQTPLTTSEAIQAFDSVLAMNGVTMVNVGEKFVKAVPVTLAFQQAAPFSTNDDINLPEADQYITHIAQLKYAKPSEVVSVLTPLAQIPNSILAIDSSSILIIRDYAGNVKRMLELLKQIDVTEPLEYDSEVIPIKYAQASDIASALSSLGSGTGTTIGKSATTGGNRSNTGVLGGGALGGGGGIGGIGGNNGYGNTSGTQNGFGGIGGTQGGIGGAGRTSSLQDRVGAIVRRAAAQGEFQVLGQTKIIADQRTNSLLVFANKQDMEMIKKIVGELDIVLAQVLIEAIIMEVSLDTSHSLGVSYLQKNASTPGNYFSGVGAINNGTFLTPNNFLSNGTNGPSVPSGLSYFANFGGDFDATLTAIANDSHINVLSRPRIQTSHGVSATLQVGQQVPIVSGTYFGGINGQASSQYQEQFVGISLQVTPLINPDGLVVMDISQNVQQLGPNFTIDGNPVPSTTQRSAQATVSVKDRDTIILGGMIQTSKNVSNAGVPLLKDIPGIGYLFRTSSSDSQRTELIVLIRPTVLPTPESAALVAAHERDKLPGIKAAERESRLDENRRLKAADKIKLPDERE